MKLVHYQIEHIKEYIDGQGIRYDDVKAELLDHIICSVEDRMKERGGFFPTLHKLEADGLLTTETQKVDNRVRKYYSLTKQGNAEVKSKVAELEEFLVNLHKILNPKLGIG